MNESTYDVLVIGGGINGVGVAADAAGRGLKVALCEANDLASATSSWSSKLIHGGLRYLEHREFRLVKEALAEREVLLDVAPHLVTPLRFHLPHHSGLRPAWMIRMGLFLYDHLSQRRRIEGSRGIRFDDTSPLKDTYRKGFAYSDCKADDSRLVVMMAKLAEQHEATILPRHKVLKAHRHEGVWVVEVATPSGGRVEIQAKALVNAGGPWVRRVLDTFAEVKTDKAVRLVKGSHLVVPKLYDQPQAYILQNSDNRIVFVIPFQEDYSLVGTTDVDYEGDPAAAAIDDDEIEYLIAITNDYFKAQIQRSDIVWTYSGVRPLMQGERPEEAHDASQVSRDYHFEVEDQSGQAPLLSIFGGKLTTFRKLAEAAVNALNPWFPEMGQAWTKQAVVPGAEGIADPEQYAQHLQSFYPFIDARTARRLAFTYGRLCETWLASAQKESDLGERFGPLYEAEVRYLVAHEWAQTADDILWRRTKAGVGLSKDEIARLEAYLAHLSRKAAAEPWVAASHG